MKMMEDVKTQRKRIRTNSKSKTRKQKKGSKGVNSATRLCAVCHRQLCNIDNLGKPYVTVAHTEYKLGDILTAYMCDDIRSCRRQLGEEGEADES